MEHAPRSVVLDASPLSPTAVAQAARHGATVVLADAARRQIEASRQRLESVLGDGLAHYGVNTGFGSFSRQRIAPGDLQDLQHNLIRSHAAGVGSPLRPDIVRGMMLLLAASLSRGLSGVRLSTVEALVAALNWRGRGGEFFVPVVPETGSCGASGDLAPLAHVILSLMGEGEVFVAPVSSAGHWSDTPPKSRPAREALALAGLGPIRLEAKEGLALINGTHLMAARAALLVGDFEQLFDAALTAAAMSIDACRATDAFLDDRVFMARAQPGARRIAQRLRELLDGSEIVRSHVENDPRVQDPYSLRCCPQVLGGAWDLFEYVRAAAARELGAVTDNPLVFAADEPSRGEIVSAGNFHGMPIALPLDSLSLSIAHVAGIAERRIAHIMAAGAGEDLEAHLPAFLSPKSGLHSGFMIAHYTAAACCNEIVGLTMPASVSNFTTSAGMEDYNSWGPRSAAKAERALTLARQVVSIELLCAAEGIEHHRPLKSGAPIERAHAAIRRVVPRLVADRSPAPDIAAIESLILAGTFNLTEK
ncbi:MAG TPA: histidine ammonia-lyase [Phycisphaerales bacterium]|nr:histidine ammonia-lyase [Phycisphaerales bacterium]